MGECHARLFYPFNSELHLCFGLSSSIEASAASKKEEKINFSLLLFSPSPSEASLLKREREKNSLFYYRAWVRKVCTRRLSGEKSSFITTKTWILCEGSFYVSLPPPPQISSAHFSHRGGGGGGGGAEATFLINSPKLQFLLLLLFPFHSSYGRLSGCSPRDTSTYLPTMVVVQQLMGIAESGGYQGELVQESPKCRI